MHKTVAEAKQFFDHSCKDRKSKSKRRSSSVRLLQRSRQRWKRPRVQQLKSARKTFTGKKMGHSRAKSARMLKDLGVDYVIIGHSERRAYFAETDKTVNKKVHAAFNHGLTRSFASGEAGRARSGRDENVVQTQTEAAFEGIDAEQAKDIVIAYEPIWAIGTGKSSTAADANEVIALHSRSSCRIYSTEKQRKRSAFSTAAV